MADDASTADALQRQMQQVRAEMREDVQEMVASARHMADWTYYVRTYPWVCVGAAAAIGYLIVPARRQPPIKPDAKDLLELARQQKIVVKVEEPRHSPGLLGTLVRMAAGPLLQGGLAILKHQIDQQLRPQPPRPVSSDGPVSSNGNGRGPQYD
jgi:hypothetical protein